LIDRLAINEGLTRSLANGGICRSIGRVPFFFEFLDFFLPKTAKRNPLYIEGNVPGAESDHNSMTSRSVNAEPAGTQAVVGRMWV
ncbi:MAG: hypothetical protein R6T89_03590, partial [Candidatus Syntrophosphaera sp.]